MKVYVVDYNINEVYYYLKMPKIISRVYHEESRRLTKLVAIKVTPGKLRISELNTAIP